MSNFSKPVIIFSLGDPTGIGPEIVVRALANPKLANRIIPVCIGNGVVIRECMEKLEADFTLREMSYYDTQLIKHDETNVVYLIEPPDIEKANFKRGHPDRLSGECAVQSILAACDILKSYTNYSLITAPLSKKAVQLGKYSKYKGYTEILAEQFLLPQSNVKNMLIARPFSKHALRMTHVYSHVPLRKVPELIVTENGRAQIIRTIQLTWAGLVSLGITQPKIAVTGMNPHLEEWEDKDKWGQLGKEEIESIIPAIHQLQKDGLEVTGPMPADAAYRYARDGYVDGVVGMFHDQSHIAAQSDSDGMKHTIVFTIGTPFLRMSTSHGVATDIADQFRADSTPIENCIRMVLKLSTKSVN